MLEGSIAFMQSLKRKKETKIEKDTRGRALHAGIAISKVGTVETTPLLCDQQGYGDEDERDKLSLVSCCQRRCQRRCQRSSVGEEEERVVWRRRLQRLPPVISRHDR